MNDFSARVGKDMPKEVKQQIDTVNKQITAVEGSITPNKS
jgi:hypothetical protein